MSKTQENRGFSVVELLIVVAFIVVLSAAGFYVFNHNNRSTQTKTPSLSNKSNTSAFNYGFDFSVFGPDKASFDYADRFNIASAVNSAIKVLDLFPGIIMDQPLYGFGSSVNPEPTNGHYDLSGLQSRLGIISNAKGMAVMTLINAPSWMHPGSNSFSEPPDPQFYVDYANLCAYVAKSLPQIKYFVVWAEMRKFYQYDHSNFGAANYTTMYNDVYRAIKAARPNDLVGGPYADMASTATPYPNTTASTLHGAWGYIDPAMQNAFTYWLKHKVGADFVAIDGATDIALSNNASLTSVITASQKYALVDQWIRSQTTLPIWWMESHIAPLTGWGEQEGAAARIATLILMNTSGASVGMQWQPQDQPVAFKGLLHVWPDEGLWTPTNNPDGGQATDLANTLMKYLPTLRKRLSLVGGQPSGVLVAKTKNGDFIMVNTTSQTAKALIGNNRISLQPFQTFTSYL